MLGGKGKAKISTDIARTITPAFACFFLFLILYLVLPRHEIPESVVVGMEGIFLFVVLSLCIYISFVEEPEPEQAPQLASEVEHKLRSFPFVEVELFRGTSKGISSGNLFNRPDTVVGRFKGSVAVRSLSGSSKKNEAPKVDVTEVARIRPYHTIYIWHKLI